MTTRNTTRTASRVSHTPPPRRYTTRSRVRNPLPLPPPPPSILRLRRRRLDRRRRRRIQWNLRGIASRAIAPISPLVDLEKFNEYEESDRLRRRLHLETMAEALAAPAPSPAPPPEPQPNQPLRRSARLAARAPPRRSARLAAKERVNYKE